MMEKSFICAFKGNFLFLMSIMAFKNYSNKKLRVKEK